MNLIISLLPVTAPDSSLLPQLSSQRRCHGADGSPDAEGRGRGRGTKLPAPHPAQAPGKPGSHLSEEPPDLCSRLFAGRFLWYSATYSEMCLPSFVIVKYSLHSQACNIPLGVISTFCINFEPKISIPFNFIFL